jgi:hypothetical protein
MYTRFAGLALQGWKVIKWSTNLPLPSGVITLSPSIPGVLLPLFSCVTLRTLTSVLE